MKTLEEIRKEFYEEFTKPFPYGNITNGQFEYIWDSSKPSPGTIWNFIESTISQTKQEIIKQYSSVRNKLIDMYKKRKGITIPNELAELALKLIEKKTKQELIDKWESSIHYSESEKHDGYLDKQVMINHLKEASRKLSNK